MQKDSLNKARSLNKTNALGESPPRNLISSFVFTCTQQVQRVRERFSPGRKYKACYKITAFQIFKFLTQMVSSWRLSDFVDYNNTIRYALIFWFSCSTILNSNIIFIINSCCYCRSIGKNVFIIYINVMYIHTSLMYMILLKFRLFCIFPSKTVLFLLNYKYNGLQYSQVVVTYVSEIMLSLHHMILSVLIWKLILN